LLLPGLFRLCLILGIASGFASAVRAETLPDWWTAPLGGEAPATSTAAIADESPHVAGPAWSGSLTGNQPAAIDCLAKAIAYEAGNEPLAGRQAVAQVILNRVSHRAYPKTVCGVVYQGSGRRTGCQFTFTCDGSLQRSLSRRTWDAALAVAQQALAGQLPATVGAATHYHANYVSPRWAPALIRVGVIGAHIFYQLPGARPAALSRMPATVPPVGDNGFSPWGLSVENVTPPSS
jgi:spore germination cell wall hydrolase CwlJ-like protein